MKIVFVGNFSASFSTESHHLWTYRKLGHQVIPLQEGKVTSGEIWENMNHADILVWTHTHGWKTEGIKDLLIELKQQNKPSIGYHLDLWKGIKREADLNSDDYWNIEYFFTVDKEFLPDLKAKGIKAYFLPAGVVENECYLGAYRKDLAFDVGFVGSYNYHPEWKYRSELIDFLNKNYGERFQRFAGDTKFGTMRGADLNNLYASTKVFVGDTLCPNFNKPDYFSDRLFEATGRGGVMIFPYIKGIENYFEEDELLTYKFGNFDELKNKIDYLLDNDTIREQFRLKGHLRTKKDHTYTNRLLSLFEKIQINHVK